jgi:hypothetical protein
MSESLPIIVLLIALILGIPIAFALAGALAEFIPLAPLIGGCFLVSLVAGVPIIIAPSFRRFINFDPLKDTVESVS